MSQARKNGHSYGRRMRTEQQPRRNPVLKSSRELWWKPLHFISSRCVHRQLFKGLAQASSGQPAAHSAFPRLIQKNTAAKILYQAAVGTHGCRWDGQFPLIQGSGLGKSLSWDRSVGFCEAWEFEHRPEHVRDPTGIIQAQPLPSVLLSSPGKGRAKDKAQMGCLSVLHPVAAAIVVVWRAQKEHIAETLGQKIKMEPLFCLWKKTCDFGEKTADSHLCSWKCMLYGSTYFDSLWTGRIPTHGWVSRMPRFQLEALIVSF